MSLFSFFRKNKQEAPSEDGEFYSRAEDELSVSRARGKRKSKQSDAPSDPVLPEKKRARRRLVGAIALVLAAIIGLPMILDSEPQPLAQDISIQIPSKDQPRPSRQLRAPVPAAEPYAQPAAQPEQIMEPAAPAAAADAPGKTTSVDRGNQQAASEPGSKAAASVPKIQIPSKPEIKSELKQAAPEPKSTSKIEAKASLDDAREEARAKAILEGKPVAKTDAIKTSVDTKSGKFVVQVAALASKEKINELRNKLKAAGIQSQVQKVATASGDRTRIRVGPFASREDAEKMRARLIKLGLNGTLVPVGL